MNPVNQSNDLILHTKFEKLDTVSFVTNAEWEMSTQYQTYFTEMLQNFKRVHGYILGAADIRKLSIEERPKFIYNLIRPIILQLVGNFINNQSRVEAIPKTPGDVRMAGTVTDMIDYVHTVANDLTSELATAFANAIIGRVGWIYQDWGYNLDPEGMMEIRNWDPFRVMWDAGFSQLSKMRDCNLIINRGWYTPEEIRNMFAINDDDLFDEITEKSKLYLGTEQDRSRKLIPYLQRTFGAQFNRYAGKDQGYDETTSMLNSVLYSNGNYFDASNGMFKVVEAHERRQVKKIVLYNPINNQTVDVTQYVEMNPGGGRFDQNKIAAISERFYQRFGIVPVIKSQLLNQIFQTSVIPAFNIVAYEAPYAVQNGNFKFTPLFCFNFGVDSLDWKSYVDDMIDPVMAFNLRMNQIATYMGKVAAGGETWAEEDALGEHEDAFLENKIGAVKKVKKDKLDKIKNIQPSTFPNGLGQDAVIQEGLVKTITGVKDNALGTQESANESGKLYQSRVAQADLLQTVVQDNSVRQLKQIGENTKDYLFTYMQPGRIIRITRDETNPYWLQIHENSIQRLVLDAQGNPLSGEEVPGKINVGKYDIQLTKAPVGEAARQKELMEMMTLADFATKIGRPDYIKFDLMVKASGLKTKDEWLSWISMMDQQRDMLLQQQRAVESQNQDLQAQQQQIGIEQQALQLKGQKQEADVEQVLQNSLVEAIS